MGWLVSLIGVGGISVTLSCDSCGVFLSTELLVIIWASCLLAKFYSCYGCKNVRLLVSMIVLYYKVQSLLFYSPTTDYGLKGVFKF